VPSVPIQKRNITQPRHELGRQLGDALLQLRVEASEVDLEELSNL
jgi:hypothetical protein